MTKGLGKRLELARTERIEEDWGCGYKVIGYLCAEAKLWPSVWRGGSIALHRSEKGWETGSHRQWHIQSNGMCMQTDLVILRTVGVLGYECIESVRLGAIKFQRKLINRVASKRTFFGICNALPVDESV